MIIHLNPEEILNFQLFCYCSITLTLIENNPDIIWISLLTDHAFTPLQFGVDQQTFSDIGLVSAHSGQIQD